MHSLVKLSILSISLVCAVPAMAEDLTMAVTPAGAGITVPAEGGPYPYALNEVVSISASPNAGYRFVQWTVNTGSLPAAPTSASTTVTMDVTKTVTAVFEKIELTMAVIADNPSAGTTTPAAGGTYPYNLNEVVNISAIAVLPGYTFSRWIVSAGSAVADPNAMSTTVTMDVAKTVTAVFVQPARFSDNFETYLVSCPEPPPNYCNCVGDGTAFRAAWPAVAGFGNGSLKSDFSNCATNSGFRGWSPPFSYMINKYAAQMNRVDLAAIASGLDPSKNAFNGTDANPLILEMYFWAQTGGKEDNTAFFAQLYAEDSRVPVSQTVPDPNNPGQYIDVPLRLIHASPCTGNSDIQNITPSIPRKAMAFGFFGGENGLQPKLDCNLSNWMLYQNVIYDGDHWSLLKENFPTPGDQINASEKWTWLKMTIKSATFDLDVRSSQYPATQTRRGIPRAYTGGFQSLALGTTDYPGPNWTGSDYPCYADNITLTGGVLDLVVPRGACCLPPPSLGCQSNTTESDCTALGGIWQGAGSSCDDPNINCCPDPFADADWDHDVDQADFAAFQACFTGPGGGVPERCSCFNHVLTGVVQGIDSDDWMAFEACASGPGMPADPACD
ncbi:MAG: InlB B-repeat-containing protein [Phycisphaerae bacterium]